LFIDHNIKADANGNAHPLVSIITVVYNNVEFIRDAIESVLSQTYPNVEYVVIDGGSTDGTVEIIEEYREKISVIISESDDGIYDGMNKGIIASSGDIIGFLNSDDFYSSSSILEIVTGALKKPGIMACFGDLCYVDRYSVSRIVRYWKSSRFYPGLFSRGWCPPHPTFFVRRSIYEQYGKFDLSYKIAADAELMMRFLEHFYIPVIYIPEILVHMRMGGESNKNIKNVFIQNLEIWSALKRHDLHPFFFTFVWEKILSRTKQYFFRPKL
jgi:glycosyltransferase involved in cell wall biosynthesis